jgi:outer membrane lipoprotein SlyB
MSQSLAKKLCAVTVAGAMSVSLIGCTGTGGPKEESGAVIGAVAGGLLGAAIGGGRGGQAIAAAVIGAAAGSMIGAAIGAELDEQDRLEMQRMTQASFETGAPRAYVSKRTGVRAKTRVVKTTKTADNKTCRTVQQEVTLKDGTTKSDTVSACKSDQGWVV